MFYSYLFCFVIALGTSSTTSYMVGSTIETHKIMWTTWIVFILFFLKFIVKLNTNSTTSHMVGNTQQKHKNNVNNMDDAILIYFVSLLH